MAGVTRLVQFGSQGPAGATGPAGPPGAAGATGPAGPSGFSLPVSGVSTIDPTTKRIEGYRSAQSIEGGVSSFGAGVIVLDHVLGPRSSKVLIQAWTTRNSDGKMQTLDAARRVEYTGGSWSIAVSGSDVADDSNTLGTAWSVTLQTSGANRVIRIIGTIASGHIHGATVNEVW